MEKRWGGKEMIHLAGKMMGQTNDAVSMKMSDPVRNAMGVAKQCKAKAPKGH